jgi:hypothetical protein
LQLAQRATVITEMSLMRRALLIVSALLVLVFTTLYSVDRFKAKKIRDERLQDVKALVEVYMKVHETFPERAITMEQLVAMLATQGVRLHNPIPRDPTKPCYQLRLPAIDTSSQMLIKETNTTDTKAIFIATRDGAIMELSAARLREMENTGAPAVPKADAISSHY